MNPKVPEPKKPSEKINPAPGRPLGKFYSLEVVSFGGVNGAIETKTVKIPLRGTVKPTNTHAATIFILSSSATLEQVRNLKAFLAASKIGSVDSFLVSIDDHHAVVAIYVFVSDKNEHTIEVIKKMKSSNKVVSSIPGVPGRLMEFAVRNHLKRNPEYVLLAGRETSQPRSRRETGMTST